MLRTVSSWALCGWLTLTAMGALDDVSARAAEANLPEKSEAESTAAPLMWHEDYRTARDEAKAKKRFLFLWFADEKQTATNEKFQNEVLHHAQVRPALAGMTLARLSTSEVIEQEGKELTLLKHHAFEELKGGPGLAMVDYRDEGEKHYGWVVTIYPFHRGPISVAKLKVLCELPPGTLTQRTLIFAVRTHPSAPQSAWSPHSKYLAAEAEKHSLYQASILLQGHHHWESRFHEINANLGIGGAREVCAESWSGQPLLEAAEECVHSWSQSPGHWEAVSARHSYFGYDMKRGTNGVWYATGIFGGR
jgi:hypothetical protein